MNAATKKLRVWDATRVHLLPIKERILYWFGPGCLDYHTLMDRCFPPEHFPLAHRCSSNGGPPGCAMAFGKALRELGITRGETRLWRSGK